MPTLIRREDPITSEHDVAAARRDLERLVLNRAAFRRITLDEYHRMLETGILQSGDPYELLNGYIVRKDRSAAGEDPLTVGDEHAWAVQGLVELNARLRRMNCHVRIQQPIAIPPVHEPEPDGAVVRGGKDDYRHRKPNSADVLCVIEVSDSSLERDRTVKLAAYAEAGIEQYIIVNLPAKVIEVYTEPLTGQRRYGQVQTLHPKHKLLLAAGRTRTLSVPVGELLP